MVAKPIAVIGVAPSSGEGLILSALRLASELDFQPAFVRALEPGSSWRRRSAERQQQDLEAARRSLWRQLGQLPEHDRRAGQVAVGKPYQVINDVAGSLGAELIFVGRPERGRWGSTVDRLLRTTSRPVWITADGGAIPRRALAAIDLSEGSAQAYRYARRLLSRGPTLRSELEWEIHCVVDVTEGPARLPKRRLEDQVVAELRAIEESARGPGQAARHTVGIASDPTQGLVERIEHAQSDLCILGTHGHGQVERFLIGTVTSGLAHRTPCDLLVVPPETAYPTSRELGLGEPPEREKIRGETRYSG